jgi:pimeloyl-ACP methyl ester carboxylesterase
MAIGTGSTMAEWDPALLRLLARRHRLILFDYPGVGRSSPRRTRRTSFARMADQTARFMRAIGVPRADVLGWSMGGFVAQQLAIRHAGQVDRLILAGTNPGGAATVLGPRWAQEIDSGADSDADALKVLYPRTRHGRAEGRAFLRRLERASATGEIPDDFRVPRVSLAAQVAAEDPWLRSDANLDALAHIETPTLVAGGTRDVVVPPANARAIARRIPHARLDLYPGAGHAFLFEDRGRFARAVDGFLLTDRARPATA